MNEIDVAAKWMKPRAIEPFSIDVSGFASKVDSATKVVGLHLK